MIPGLKAIPAFNGAGSAGSGGGSSGLTFTFLASATASAPSITIPAAAIAGDYAILFDFTKQNSGSVSAVTPTGWTNLKNDSVVSTDGYRAMVSHRILTGGGSVTGMNDTSNRKALLVFRPTVAIAALTPSSWNGEATTGNPTSQTVSASGVTTPLIVFALAACSSGTAASFSTETPSMTNLTLGGGGISIRVGYTVYNSSPSDQSIDMNDNGINILQSGYVRFT